MKTPDLSELCPLIVKAAREELLPRFARSERHYKADGSVVTEADLAMQQRLCTELAARWPEYGLLGEEMPAERQRAVFDGPGGFWCLDPVDGTSNYAAGLPFFAVSLALMVERRPLLGVVYDPVRDECFSARVGAGAWCNDRPLRLAGEAMLLHRCIALVDFKRLPGPLAARLATHPPYASQRNLGSAALEWCWLAAGRVQLYLHGRQSLWDLAAAALILTEAGGACCQLDGSPLLDDRLSPRGVMAATGPGLLAELRGWMAQEG